MTTPSNHSSIMYYAIRQSATLRGPAIFSTWEDASVHIETKTAEKDEEHPACQYKKCKTLQEAVDYLGETKLTAAAAVGGGVGGGTTTSFNRRPLSKTAVEVLLKKSSAQQNHIPLMHLKNTGTSLPFYIPPLPFVPRNPHAPTLPPILPFPPPAVVPTIQKVAAASEPRRDTSRILQKKRKPEAAETNKARKKAARLDKVLQNRLERFQTNLKLLQEYKAEHGTCDIPARHHSIQNNRYTPLGRWIPEMRKQAKLIQENKLEEAYISPDHLHQLTEAGFVFDPKRGHEERFQAKLELEQQRFDEMLDQLKQFKQTHGHTNVPDFIENTKKRSALRTWILRLRDEYDKLKQGKRSVLTMERISQLTQLGFSLAPPYRRRSFEERAYEVSSFLVVIVSLSNCDALNIDH